LTLFVGPLFVLGVAGVLLLGWAYSVPPLRLKTRAGWDVAVNAVVVGVVSPVAGWSITRDPWQFPWQFGLIGMLFAAAECLHDCPNLSLTHPGRLAGHRAQARLCRASGRGGSHTVGQVALPEVRQRVDRDDAEFVKRINALGGHGAPVGPVVTEIEQVGELFSQGKPAKGYARLPASIHWRKRATRSAGHAPSHGIVPASSRPRIALA
jgi:hypothetical protein